MLEKSSSTAVWIGSVRNSSRPPTSQYGVCVKVLSLGADSDQCTGVKAIEVAEDIARQQSSPWITLTATDSASTSGSNHLKLQSVVVTRRFAGLNTITEEAEEEKEEEEELRRRRRR